MRLLFDARYIRPQFHDGISRFTLELGTAVWQQHPDTVFIVSDPAQVPLLPDGAETVRIHPPTSVKEPLASIILRKYKPDVVFSPLQSIGSIGRYGKLILTVHDLIYYHHRTPPAQFNWFVRLMWRLFYISYVPQRLALNAADMIATVSNTSAAEISATRLTKRPIVITPNAPRDLSELLPAGTRVTHDPAGPRNLIYMGSFLEYKNVKTLVQAMDLLPEHTLHLLSRVSPQVEQALTALTARGNLVFHHGVSDQQYAELLADNAVLVTASKDEGFGLPLVESAKMGVPAVVSELPVFHEILRSAGVYFAADDPRDFAAKVTTLDDPDRLRQLCTAVKVEADRYQWSASAATLLEACTKLSAAN